IVEKGFLVYRCVLGERFLFGHGVADDLVVDVGDVHDVVEPHAAEPQPAAKNVVEGEGAEISDMGETVDGWSARVHAHGVVPGGGKLFHLVRQSIGKT